MSNFGSTLILASIGFVIIILIVLVAILVAKSCKLSKKNKQRVQYLKRKIFYNSIIRYILLNTLKFYMSAMVVLKKSDGNGAKFAQSVSFLLFLSALPIYFLTVVYRNRESLEMKEKSSKFGALYSGKNVSNRAKHRVWLFPMTFFYRRLIFICVSVFLFDTPSMQMLVHQVLTMATLIYLLSFNQRFVSREQKVIEIGSEMLMLLTSLLI